MTTTKPLQMKLQPVKPAQAPSNQLKPGDRVTVNGRLGIIDDIQPDWDERKPEVCFVVGLNLEWDGWIETTQIEKIEQG